VPGNAPLSKKAPDRSTATALVTGLSATQIVSVMVRLAERPDVADERARRRSSVIIHDFGARLEWGIRM